ncbi:MAG: polysaccharide biosynthesis/export family protein [Prevotellaceae bacterium]|jgi:polysaccharide export outer membrane protein|nr:polysaccharide biosynthesis/export family protein [Prevotellaceae bacterium]
MSRIAKAAGVIALSCIILSSCESSKRVVYLQDLGTEVPEFATAYEAHIVPKDLLTISVSTDDPEAAVPFNLIIPTAQTTLDQGGSIYTQPILQNYLVDDEGNISFPVLGKLKVGGMTTSQISAMIVERLHRYLKEAPIVTVRLVNYKVSVIGEVARPNSYTISNERIGLFEALAMAGDLTIYGRRDNVRIIRRLNDGSQQIITMNLNDKNIIHSPDFYLHQNDVVYVEPNRARRQSSDIGSATTLMVSITSILISIASLMVNIIKN